jgi:3-phenylpropionate/trans-cinnamate dioxygenase ferredoxin subunit
MGWVRIARSEEVGAGPRVFLHGGRGVIVCRADAALRAFEDRCSHDDGPLAGDRLDGCVIECPRHGARFDVRTGRVLRMPAAAPIAVFPAREEEGWVLVDLDEGEEG